jgi:hypothetical protein
MIFDINETSIIKFSSIKTVYITLWREKSKCPSKYPYSFTLVIDNKDVEFFASQENEMRMWVAAYEYIIKST